MRLSLPYFFNRLIILSGKLTHQRYHRYANNVEMIQTQKLSGYLKANSNTAFGKLYNFKSITNYILFAKNVPVIEDWKQVEPFITRIENGEKKILTDDPVRSFEETSGSSGFSKLIPYNRPLKKEFQKALQVWMSDLHTTWPAAFYGRSYWSLSPVLKETRFTSSGIRIGLEMDAEYFNPFIGFLISKTMAVDPSVIKIKDSNVFYFETLQQLLCKKDLSFVSVWSPTFFLQLDNFLRNNLEQLIKAISIIDPKRSSEINKIPKKDFTWKDLWPQLALI
ncbi:MAG: GH3 auxin-responsive promoter family protein, partial [Ginsengibacter sp.]